MSRIVQIETGYKPKLTRAEQEREDLRELALAAMSEGQFEQAYRFMTDMFKFLKVVAGQATLIDR